MIIRQLLAKALGIQYGGARNIYDAFGYKENVTFSDYMNYYKRNGIGYTVIERPCSYTWKDGFSIETEDNVFLETFNRLYDSLRLKHKFKQLDKLSMLGEYAVMLIGTTDLTNIKDFETPVTSSEIRYLKVYSCKSATILSIDKNVNSERYGLPELYQINQNGTTLAVHYTRILHITEELLDNEIYGIPYMLPIYNNIFDIEKISGASAEAYYRGARPGYSAEVSNDYNVGKDTIEGIQKQIAEFEHDMRRFLLNEGVSIKSLAQQITDPINYLKSQLQIISGKTGIPLRILIGSERGELSSAQDTDSFNSLIEMRRNEFAESGIIIPFIQWCVTNNVLPETDYEIVWQPLYATSQKEKIENGKLRAEILKFYTANPLLTEFVSFEWVLKYLAEMEQDEVDAAVSYLEGQIENEINNTNNEEEGNENA